LQLLQRFAISVAVSTPSHLSPLQTARLTTQGQSDQPSNGLQLQLLGDRLLPLSPPRTPYSVPRTDYPNTIALITLENTHLDEEAIQRAKFYRAIATGSTWNHKLLQKYGLNPIQVPLWGVDPTLFYPGAKTHLFSDRFVIFSSGQLSYSRGQDILIAAFKVFQSRHPEALLVTAWGTTHTNQLKGLNHKGYVTGLPELDSNNQLLISAWLIANGLSPDSFLDLGVVSYPLLGQVLRESNVAVFPSRCETGMNQTAISSLACGIPTILSNNTGHQDLLCHNLGYPLQSQRSVKANDPMIGMAGWGESDVEELVEILEYIYTDSATAQHRGIAAAEFMREWTWEKQCDRLLELLKNVN
jgi:glycosyltransferase involved in cell wall biosynthesis